MTSSDNHDPLLGKLQAANPHPLRPLTAEEKHRSEQSLADIFAQQEEMPQEAPTDLDERRQRKQRRSPWYAAAAAVGVFMLAGALLPQIIGTDVIEPVVPEATAEEVLLEAADSSALQPDVVDIDVTGVEFLQRIDRDETGSVTTQFETDAAGKINAVSQSEGNPGPLLQEFAENPIPEVSSEDLITIGEDAEQLRSLALSQYGDVAVGSLHLLLHPAISAGQQKVLYENLAQAGGNDVAHVKLSPTGGEDEIVSLIREEDQMSFDVIPSTGQLTRVVGLMGPGVTTTVESTAILGCVHVTGLNGPDTLSTACADNNYTLVDLNWSRWGAAEATATGRAFINNCDPYCAEGTFEEFDVSVTADERASCGYNTEVYTRLRVKFDDENRERDEVFEMGCVDLPPDEE